MSDAQCLPVEQWPASDRQCWAAAFRVGGLLDEPGAAAGWAAATGRKIRKGYGRWLGFLTDTGQLDPAMAPELRVSSAKVQAYVAELRLHNNSGTVFARVQELSIALRVMTPHWPAPWLTRLVRRLKHARTPARDDRARLLPATSLFELGRSLMARADTAAGMASSPPALRDIAATYRDGLMIALLCICPLRVKNLAAMRIGRHLIRDGAQFQVIVDATETKNRRRFELPLPELFNGWIETYLMQHRPRLLQENAPTDMLAEGWMWISERRTPLAANGINYRINAVTLRELGQAVNPHLFRKIVSTELAMHDPAHVGVAQRLLGHSNYRTTQDAYNLGRAMDAARLVHQLLANLRSTPLALPLTAA